MLTVIDNQVKGGGHASNPGFSSTEGVHIAMSKFNDVTYDADSNTAEVGAGLVWDDVYAALEPYAVNVVGGRVTGVGVAGFTLGGGASIPAIHHVLAHCCVPCGAANTQCPLTEV